MPLRTYPIRRLAEDPSNVLDRARWPAALPPVAHILDQGLDPDPIGAYQRSGYGEKIAAERVGGAQAGWGA